MHWAKSNILLKTKKIMIRFNIVWYFLKYEIQWFLQVFLALRFAFWSSFGPILAPLEKIQKYHFGAGGFWRPYDGSLQKNGGPQTLQIPMFCLHPLKTYDFWRQRVWIGISVSQLYWVDNSISENNELIIQEIPGKD